MAPYIALLYSKSTGQLTNSTIISVLQASEATVDEQKEQVIVMHCEKYQNLILQF